MAHYKDDYVTMDSGERRTWETGARRDVDTDKPRYDLIPVTALRQWAELMGRGAVKYGDRNWEKGMPVSVFVASALRHFNQFLEGDRSENHLAAVLFNVGGILQMVESVEKGILPEYYLDEGAAMATIANQWTERAFSVLNGKTDSVLLSVQVRHGDIFFNFNDGFAFMSGREYCESSDEEVVEKLFEQLTAKKTGV